MFVYMIRSKTNERHIYIGSTKGSVKQRWYLHKTSYNMDLNSPLYNFIRENGGTDNFYIEEYEAFDKTITDMKIREGEIIIQYMDNPDYQIINKNIAGQTPLQYKNRKYKTDEQFREKLKKINLERYYKNKQLVLKTPDIPELPL